MNPETIKEIQNALTPLASKIGEGAAHLYQIYVRQMVVEGISTLIIVGIFLLLIPIVWYVCHKLEKESGSDGIMYFIAGVFTFMVLLFGAVISVPEGIGKLVNPEYYAIERLVDQAKGDN